jgi:hypothetical protein
MISFTYDGTLLTVSDSTQNYVISYLYSSATNQYVFYNNSTLPSIASCMIVFPDGLYTVYGEAFSAGTMNIRILNNSDANRIQVDYYTYTTNYSNSTIYRISVS